MFTMFSKTFHQHPKFVQIAEWLKHLFFLACILTFAVWTHCILLLKDFVYCMNLEPKLIVVITANQSGLLLVKQNPQA